MNFFMGYYDRKNSFTKGILFIELEFEYLMLCEVLLAKQNSTKTLITKNAQYVFNKAFDWI